MAVAYVQGTGNRAHAQSLAVAFPGNVTQGNLLVVGVGFYKGDYSANTIKVADLTDSRGNTWSLDVHQGGYGSQDHAIFSCIAKDTGACTVTFNDTDDALYDWITMGIAEFSGVTVNTVEDSNSAEVTGTDIHHGNVVMSAAGVIVGLLVNNENPSTITPDGNWTQIYEEEDASNWSAINFTYRLVNSGTYNDGWTLGTSREVDVMGVAYLGTAAGGAAALPVFMANYRQRIH